MNSQGPEVTEHVSGRCHSHEKDRPLWALYFSLFWQGAFLKVEESHMPKTQLQSICSILKSFRSLQNLFKLIQFCLKICMQFEWNWICFRAQAACLQFKAKGRWISIRCSHYNLSPPVVFNKIAGKCNIMYGQDLPTSSSVPSILV